MWIGFGFSHTQTTSIECIVCNVYQYATAIRKLNFERKLSIAFHSLKRFSSHCKHSRLIKRKSFNDEMFSQAWVLINELSRRILIALILQSHSKNEQWVREQIPMLPSRNRKVVSSASHKL